MGLLDKFIRGANKVDEVVSDAEDAVVRPRKYDAAAKLAARGTPGAAIVTGMGSIAESRLAPETPDSTAMSTGPAEPLDLTPSVESTEAIQGVTIEQWDDRGDAHHESDSARRVRRIRHRALRCTGRPLDGDRGRVEPAHAIRLEGRRRVRRSVRGGREPAEAKALTSTSTIASKFS